MFPTSLTPCPLYSLTPVPSPKERGVKCFKNKVGEMKRSFWVGSVLYDSVEHRPLTR